MKTKYCKECGGELPHQKNSVGWRIYYLRKKKGWNQHQLAKKVGISRPSIANIEADNQDLKTAHLIKLSQLFKVSTDYLLMGKKK